LNKICCHLWLIISSGFQQLEVLAGEDQLDLSLSTCLISGLAQSHSQACPAAQNGWCQFPSTRRRSILPLQLAKLPNWPRLPRQG